MTPWLVSLAAGSVVIPYWLTVHDTERPIVLGRSVKSSWLARIPEGRSARLVLELVPPTPLRLLVLSGPSLAPAADLACLVTDASGSMVTRSWPGTGGMTSWTVALGELGAVRQVAIEASRSIPGPPVAIERIVGWTASDPTRDVTWPEAKSPEPRLHGLVIEPGTAPARCVVVGEDFPGTGSVTVDGRACRWVSSTPTQLLCEWTGKPPARPVDLVVKRGATALTRRVRAVRRNVVWPPVPREGGPS